MYKRRLTEISNTKSTSKLRKTLSYWPFWAVNLHYKNIRILFHILQYLQEVGRHRKKIPDFPCCLCLFSISHSPLFSRSAPCHSVRARGVLPSLSLLEQFTLRKVRHYVKKKKLNQLYCKTSVEPHAFIWSSSHFIFISAPLVSVRSLLAGRPKKYARNVCLIYVTGPQTLITRPQPLFLTSCC